MQNNSSGTNISIIITNLYFTQFIYCEVLMIPIERKIILRPI